MEQSSGEIPQKKEITLSKRQWSSSYNQVALETLERVTGKKIRSTHPEATDEDILKEVKPKQEKLGFYLNAIDQEFVDNFGIFRSKENPAVSFPYTKISVDNVAGGGKSLTPESEAKRTDKKLTYVVFAPFTLPPGGDPDGAMNTIYDRVFISMPEVARRDVDIYALGVPTSQWGTVSTQWIEDLKKHGFSQFGKLYAEFLRTVVSQDKTHFIFRADSMGTIFASETAKQMPELWDNLQLLLDVPTGVHKPQPVPIKGAQVAIGFGVELAARFVFESMVRKSLLGQKKAREELAQVLKGKGIYASQSDEQKKIKGKAFREYFKLLIKGTPLDTEDFISYVVQGMLDPSTLSIKRLKQLVSGKKLFKAGNRSLEMGINYTHWMDRGRWLDKWFKKIEQYEKLTRKN